MPGSFPTPCKTVDARALCMRPCYGAEADGVIARPRASRVKETSLALLPELAETILSAPVYTDVCGPRIFNVDPRTIGGTWRIEKGEVDRIIVLHPNHGGYSSLRSMAPTAVAQALISEVGM